MNRVLEFLEKILKDGEAGCGLVGGGGKAAMDKVSATDDEVGPKCIDPTGEEAEGIGNAPVGDGVDVGKEDKIKRG
ncbi:MAG: hypothetical protein OHK005_01080 [Candidatus Methylacidiphilales bacterium]